MDPVTQGTLGAAAALALWGNDRRLSPKVVGLLGALSGMAADLDVLIRSTEDPMLAILFHRHFSHSLVFVPIGATIALLPWLALSSVRKHLRLAWLVSLVGYLTHAPLDCCTTYGTLYFWPLSNERLAFSWVSVVDPVFTLPLLAFVVLAARRRLPGLARVGLLVATSYIGLGAVQKARALGVQTRMAAARGHTPARRDVFTTFMNQVTWRSLYEVDGKTYIDQIRVPYLGRICTRVGGSLPLAPFPSPEVGPVVARGDRLMRWFSADWVARSPSDPSLLGDLRYSVPPWGLEPFWAIRDHLDDDRVEWINTRRERRIRAGDVIELIFGVPPGSNCE